MASSYLFPVLVMAIALGYRWYLANGRQQGASPPPAQPQPFTLPLPAPIHESPLAPANARAQVTGAGQTLPMPCGRCGAPMQLVAVPHANGGCGLFCSFCQTRETLPADAANRVGYLQERLTRLSQARASAEAPLATVNAIRRAWAPAIVYLGLMLAYAVYSTTRTTQAIQKAGMQLDVSLLVGLAAQLGLLSGYLVGHIGMLHSYRIAVVPLLRARPRLAPGFAIRCRTCGGDLPNVHAAQLVCNYCQTPNLLDDALTQRSGELLQQESLFYQSRAQQVFSAEIFRAPMKAFYRWGALGLVLGTVVGVTLLLLLTQ